MKAAIFMIMLTVMMPLAHAVTISGIQVASVTDDSAVIEWQTDTKATSEVKYSKDTSLSLTKSRSQEVLDHRIELTNLELGTKYYFKVQSSGEIDDNNGNLYYFNTLATDTTPPEINLNIPATIDRKLLDITGDTEPKSDIVLYVNGEAKRRTFTEDGHYFFSRVLLTEGDNLLKVTVTDLHSNVNEAEYTVNVDTKRPELNIEGVQAVVTESTLNVKGSVSENGVVRVQLNNETVHNETGNVIDTQVTLKEGNNVLIITFTDYAGNSVQETVNVRLDTDAPTIDEVEPLEGSPFYYEGSAQDDVKGKTEPNAKVYMWVEPTNGVAAGYPAIGSSFGASFSGEIDNRSANEIMDKAQFKTHADSEGNFEFDDVSFEHPGPSIIELEQEQVAPVSTEYVGNRQRDRANENEYTKSVVIMVVDGAGYTVAETYTIDIGNCYSGSFDFSVTPLPEYQTPTVLSPDRLAAGTEIISFVIGFDYNGQAENNRKDPHATNVEDNYYEITDIRLTPMRRDARAFSRDEGYRYALQVLPNQPDVASPVDYPLREKWLFRYSLGSTDEFLESDKEFWNELNSELKFPFNIEVTYTEKLPGVDPQTKTQTLCRDVPYYVDVPVDPNDVLPDKMLAESQKAINQTLEVLNEVVPALKEFSKYIGIACLGSFGLRTAVGVFRRFATKYEVAQCKFLNAIPTTKTADKCPYETEERVDKCYYIKVDGKSPFGGRIIQRADCKSEVYGGDIRVKDMEIDPIAQRHYPMTYQAWEAESALYTGYRWICDRFWCHVAPAKWTQEASVSYIQSKSYELNECAANTPNVKTLARVDNCFEVLKKNQLVGDDEFKLTGSEVLSGIKGNACYLYENALYKVESTNDIDCNGKSKLVKISMKEVAGATSAPDSLCAQAKGDTYYTADTRTCAQVCADLGLGDGECTAKVDPKKYPAGPTKDCWEGNPNTQEGAMCYCEQNLEENEEQTNNCETGACTAGPETGKFDPEKNPTHERASGEWPWSYRQWQLYRKSNQRYGINYPESRYYGGRDFSAAFGMDYLLDYVLAPETTPIINPSSQHVGAFQTACLTGITARLEMLRTILVSLQGCLKQVETTGRADAGYCRELLSQYVCNLAYKAFTFFEDSCTPGSLDDFYFDLEGQPRKIASALSAGSSAVTDTMNDMTSELSDEYGNAHIDQFMEGGAQSFSKKVCLAAFGVDVGFDLDHFFDTGYSQAVTTAPMVFSSEGAVGRREFLGFDPQSANSIYEYSAAWTMPVGCDIESYQVQLAAVTNKEKVNRPGIDCSYSINKDNPNGCDNLQGGREEIRQFAAGNRASQGDFIDKSEHIVVTSPYRYDHFKITVNLEPEWEPSRCFPAENIVGKQGVFYFPIKDATMSEALKCQLGTDGKFQCTLGELSDLGMAWIEEVECYDERTESWTRCDRLTLTLEDKDTVKVRTRVYTSGQQKMCLNTYIESVNAGKFPEQKRYMQIPALGLSQSVPVEQTLLTQIDSDTFFGDQVNTVLAVNSEDDGNTCTFDRDQNSDASDKTVGQGWVKVHSEGNVEVHNLEVIASGYSVNTEGYIVNGDNNNKVKFEKHTLKDVRFRVGGYAIHNVWAENDGNSDYAICQFRSIAPRDKIAKEQVWTLYNQLYYPDEQGNCNLAIAVPEDPHFAYKVKTEHNIQVNEKKLETPVVASYRNGVQFYNKGKAEQDNAKKIRQYELALEEFKYVWKNTLPEGTIEEFKAYMYSAGAYTEIVAVHNSRGEKLKADKVKGELLGLLGVFKARMIKADSNTELKDKPEYKKVKENLLVLERVLVEGGSQ